LHFLKGELMPEQNPIVEAEPSGAGRISPFSPSALRSGSILVGRFRWVICGLLFLGVTKNYMDRQVLGVLKGPLQHEFGWNDIDYGIWCSRFRRRTRWE
jgi:hypothetical protein